MICMIQNQIKQRVKQALTLIFIIKLSNTLSYFLIKTKKLFPILFDFVSSNYTNVLRIQIDFSSIVIIDLQYSIRMNRRGKIVTIDQTELYDTVTKIQTEIISRISYLKQERPKCYCKHFQNLKNQCDPYDSNINYYEKFWKLFLLNQLCYAKLQQRNSLLKKFQKKIAEVQALYDERQSVFGDKISKRNRRQASEVEKKHSCPYPSCYKSYATDVSLNLHIKIKHNGGNKTERDRAAEMIFQAVQNNLPIPNFYINLPPGFLEEYRQSRRNSSNSSPAQIFQSEQHSPQND